MAIKFGSKVRQIVPAAQEGEVVARKFSDSTEQMEYHVVGANTDRWFLESEIAVVEEPKVEDIAAAGDFLKAV